MMGTGDIMQNALDSSLFGQALLYLALKCNGTNLKWNGYKEVHLTGIKAEKRRPHIKENTFPPVFPLPQSPRPKTLNLKLQLPRSSEAES